MKFIEIILEKIAGLRGIDLGNRNIEIFENIVSGTNLKIYLNSEFDPCGSCSNIIDEVTSYTDIDNIPFVEVNISGGTLYNP